MIRWLEELLSQPTHQDEDCLWCLSLFYQLCLPACQPVCSFSLCVATPLSLLVYLLCLLSLCPFISSAEGSLKVTALSILVISDCRHKRLRATSLHSQKGPCIPTKKPLLCNALMLPLLMLLLTMIESRRKTKEGWRMGVRQGQGAGEMSRGRKMEEEEEVCVSLQRWMSCVCHAAHELHHQDFCTLCTFMLFSIQSLHRGQQHTAAWHHWLEEEKKNLLSPPPPSYQISLSDVPASQVCVCVWLLLPCLIRTHF